MKESIANLKAELKDLAVKLRKEKQERYPYKYITYVTYRHKHIAYCLLRGTPMDKIESKHRDPKDGTHKYVHQEALKLVERVQKGEVYERPQDIRSGGQASVAQPASRSVWTRITELFI